MEESGHTWDQMIKLITKNIRNKPIFEMHIKACYNLNTKENQVHFSKTICCNDESIVNFSNTPT